MNENLVACRDIQVITAEIRMISNQARAYVVNAAVEIGRRLEEAKSMLEHGQWGAWVKEELGISQSSAQNYMRIFKEYGADQLTLNGAVVKSQAIGDLSYTKALKLLALPEEEREVFVEEHNVEAMSSRELERTIRELKAAQSGEESARKEVEALRAEAKAQAQRHEVAIKAEEQKTEEAVRRAGEENLKRKALEDQIQALEKEAEIAKGKIEEAEKKLAEKGKEGTVSKKEREKILQEGRAEAEEKAKAEAESLRGEIEGLKEAMAKAEREAAEARAKLAVADAGVTEFKLYFASVQDAWNKMLSAYEKVQEGEARKKLKSAMEAVLAKWKKEVEGL